jgi:hypothetical protein
VAPCITINIYFSVFLYILFNNVVDVRDKPEISWRVLIVAYSMYYPDTCLQKKLGKLPTETPIRFPGVPTAIQSRQTPHANNYTKLFDTKCFRI